MISIKAQVLCCLKIQVDNFGSSVDFIVISRFWLNFLQIVWSISAVWNLDRFGYLAFFATFLSLLYISI